MLEFLKSDSFRRAVAALVAAALPVVNAFLGQRFGLQIPAEATVSAIIVLAGYIAQSVVNSIHARATEAGTAAVTALKAQDPAVGLADPNGVGVTK